MRAVFALVAICFSGSGDAQDYGVERVRFRHLGVKQGLSQATVLSITQDKDGFVWAGTQDGLNRYDGYGFRVYKHDRSDPYSLPDNNVRRVLADARGRIWAATQNSGIGLYDPTLDRFTRLSADPTVPGSLIARGIGAIAQDPSGTVWVATLHGGLQRFDEATQRFETSRCTGSPLRMIYTIGARRSDLILGTEEGLWRCDPATGAMEQWRFGDVALDGQPQTIQVGPDDSVWIVVAYSGIYGFNARGEPHTRIDRNGDPAVDTSSARGLLLDRDGKLWFGSELHGLSRFDPVTQRLENFRHRPGREYSLSHNRAFSLFQDRDGLIWIGTWGNGLNVLDQRTMAFEHWYPGSGPQALPGTGVSAIYGDADGSYWVGSLQDGGLSHFHPERGVLENYATDPTKPDSLNANFINAIARGPDGSLWVGTSGAGLARQRPGEKKLEVYRHDKSRPGSLVDDIVQTLYFDRTGTLWVSTSSGLDALCPDCTEFRHYAHRDDDPDSLGGLGVSCVLETRSGEFWVGLRRNGLDRLDRATGRAEHFVPVAGEGDSLSSLGITALLEDRQGQIWIGTQGGGLNRMRRDGGKIRFAAITTRDGLAADAIGDLAEDARGRLWMSTTVGISRYDPSTGAIRNIGGTGGAFENGYFIGAGGRDGQGRIFFGGPAGVTLFNPAEVDEIPAPQPVLTDLRLFNAPVKLRWRDPGSPLVQPVWKGGEIALGYRQSMVSIDFGVPTAADPPGVQYAYRLEPHDQDWIETDASRRTATYTALAPGRYRFLVRARNAGGAWGPQQAELSLRTEPPPWLSWPARAGYLTIAAVIALLWWRRRAEIARRREQAQEFLRKSEERLKLALWGSGGELWDVHLPTGVMHRENRLEGVAASHEADHQTLDSYAPFVHPDDLPLFRDALVRHLKGDADAFVVSYRTYDRDHRWVWVLTRGRVVERDAEGRAVRIAGTTHDISALKNAEEALRRLNEELELRVERRTADLRTANVELRNALDRLTLTQRQLLEAEKLASLGSLVAGIAHEINTPLGIGVTAASHLSEEVTRLSREIAGGTLKRSDLDRFHHSALESAELILRNLQRADRLVKSFKQVAVDQSNEDRRIIGLGVCINEILTTLGPTLKKTPHKVVVDCPVEVVCETAPGALYQIFTNLVMNSLLHGFTVDKPGTVRIHVRREADEIAIDYSDDGVGMDETTCARMFDPFFTTRRGQGGSGLGMHIVYNLVTQALGGTIRVTSAPGRGILVAIRFPGARHGG
ncbi:two-component regulator propeller domain-containing protein [Tahibacter amnicola]|uniref:histidine kinase n=1 Tax=Tahibacter amnicola TaxID=2976241 RepID=A0ABY6BG43_9GAMM|nr:two-component regulator propeller domain-containing protein [Tahibacter amnicola]UXI66837.1 ATP-binding protein [Tahibacter amnicola]